MKLQTLFWRWWHKRHPESSKYTKVEAPAIAIELHPYPQTPPPIGKFEQRRIRYAHAIFGGRILSILIFPTFSDAKVHHQLNLVNLEYINTDIYILIWQARTFSYLCTQKTTVKMRQQRKTSKRSGENFCSMPRSTPQVKASIVAIDGSRMPSMSI